MNALSRIFGDLTNTLASMAKIKEPLVADLVEFIRSRPDGPKNIEWMLHDLWIEQTDSLAFVKARLPERLKREIWKVESGHWSADPHRAANAKLLLDLISEFELDSQ